MFGSIKSTEYRSLAEYYSTLLTKKIPVSLRSLKECKTGSDNSKAETELRLLATAINDDTAHTVILDADGKNLSTEDFAVFMKQLIDNGRDVSFYIGNHYGLNDTVRKAADTQLSLSRMTFTHECAVMLLLEQLYRVQTIIYGGKYHK